MCVKLILLFYCRMGNGVIEHYEIIKTTKQASRLLFSFIGQLN